MNNFSTTPLTLNNPYIVMSEIKEINKVTIKKQNAFFLFFFIIYLLILIQLIIILLLLEIGVILTFIIPILFVPLILNLYCCFKLKMELIKDKFEKRITVIDKYGLCFNKRYNFSLEYTDFIFIKKILHGGNFLKSAILIMNIDPNLTDLDNSNIRNRPFKFIYKFTNLMFDENEQLEKNLENIFEHKFKNKIIDEINLYVPKQNEDKDNFLIENSIKKIVKCLLRYLNIFICFIIIIIAH